MDAIVLENVTKSYDSVIAVNAVSLKVRAGAILGLLGPNGAGKTTTIRMIMNILVPDEGSIRVLDEPVSDSTRDKIGYLPEERGLYPRMKVLEIIVFLAALHGLTQAEAARRTKEWLERLGLSEWTDKNLVDLSKGMQQKVQFITSVIHRPRRVLESPRHRPDHAADHGRGGQAETRRRSAGNPESRGAFGRSRHAIRAAGALAERNLH